MAESQNIIGIVYDYDQTLSPEYMQDDVLFPSFGINPESFWQKCGELVDREGYDNELAYMKALLDYLSMDRPTNEDLKKLGAGLKFFPGLPEVFDQLDESFLSAQHRAIGIKIEHYIISSGLKALLDGSRLVDHVKAIFGCEFAGTPRAGSASRRRSSATLPRRSTCSASTRGCWIRKTTSTTTCRKSCAGSRSRT